MSNLPDDFRVNRSSAAATIEELGGVKGLKSGSWFHKLVRRSLAAYHANADGAYFRAKYPKMSNDEIASNLIRLAAQNAALVGAGAGMLMTAGEATALMTGGVALPVAVGTAIASVGADVIVSTTIHIKLIASLADLYGHPLDPDDPEDVLVAVKFFLGSKALDAAGLAAMKGGGKATAKLTKKVVSGQTLKLIQSLGSKVGMDILQKTVVRASIPVASIGIGGGANYWITRSIGKKAKAAMIQRADYIRSYQ